MEEATRNAEYTEWVRQVGLIPKIDPELAQLLKEVLEKTKQDAEDIGLPLILDFYTWRTDPKATLAQITERIEKQFPPGIHWVLQSHHRETLGIKRRATEFSRRSKAGTWR